MKHLLAELFGILLLILFVVNFIGPIANFTTGLAIHNGFKPNSNLTSVSIGTKTNPQVVTVNQSPLTPLLQATPIAFMVIVLLFIFFTAERMLGGVSSSVANASTGISIPNEPEPEEVENIPAWNCVYCGGPNPRGTELCRYCGKAKEFWNYR